MSKFCKIKLLLFLIGIFFLFSTTSFAQSTNLISNQSVELVSLNNTNLPIDWFTNKTSNGVTKFTYPVSGYLSMSALKVEITSLKNSGNAKWYFKEVPVEANKNYTYSDYYISNVSNVVVAVYKLSTGKSVSKTIASPVASLSWKPLLINFTTPINAVTVTIHHLINKVGYLTTDNFSLTPTDDPYFILNSSVETESSTNINLPISWTNNKWGTNTSTFSYQKILGHTGNHSLKVSMTKYTNGDAKWIFNPINVTPGDTLEFSDWYQSNVVTHVVVHFIKNDGSEYYLGLRDAPISSNWTRYSETFVVPENVKTMTVLHILNSIGWLTTDDYAINKIHSKGFDHAMVSITFDDGWEDNTLTALPILKSNNFLSTYYFTTTYLQNSPSTGSINTSGPQAVLAFFNDGHEIGSHSVTHPNLSLLSDAQLSDEIINSKNYLEGILNLGTVKSFSSPDGIYNDKIVSTIKQSYDSHRSTDEGYNTIENFDQYRLKVQNMTSTTTFSEFKSWVDQAIKDKSWLILVYHRVAPTNLGVWDTLQSDFINQINYLKTSLVDVKTINNTLNYISGVTPTKIPTAMPTIAPTIVPTVVPTIEPTIFPVYPTPTPSPAPVLGPNIILNPSLDNVDLINSSLPQYWNTGNWGNNFAIFTYPVDGSSGDKAAKVELTSWTDGDAKWYFQDVAVEPNKTYIFSNQYQSNITSRITLRYLHDAGNYSYVDLANVDSSTTWTNTNYEFTIPNDVHSISIFHLIETIGYLTIDKYILQKKPEPIPFDQGMVSLAFDDGWQSSFNNGLPIINLAGFKTTQYLSTSFLDTPDYLTTSEVSLLQQSGHEIGAHSINHTDLTTLNESQIRLEVTQSRVNLLNMGFDSVISFAPPFGNTNDLITRIIQESGFISSRTANVIDSGFNYKDTNPYFLKNQSMENTTTFSQIKSLIDTAINNKSWVILVFHQIDFSESQYSITPIMLQSIVDYLKQTGIKVVKVSQGVAELI